MAFDPVLADRIRMVWPKSVEVAERKMFGGLAFLQRGNMVCGVVKADLMLRLGPQAAAEALAQPNTRPMDFTGKPLKSMIYVDAAGIVSMKVCSAGWRLRSPSHGRFRPKTRIPQRRNFASPRITAPEAPASIESIVAAAANCWIAVE